MLRLIAVGSFMSLVAAANVWRLSSWRQPRAAIVRDTLYIDGGDMYNATWDGSAWVPGVTPQGAPQDQGLMYTLFFNKSFHIDTDFWDLFEPLSTGGASNNPLFRNGFMFADDYEFYTYGGISVTSGGIDADLINDQIFKPDGNEPTTIVDWHPRFDTHYNFSSESDARRYVTHGAGANIPSEYLGYYFSGMQTVSGEYIGEFDSSDLSTAANVTLNQMLEVNMDAVGNAEWTSLQLPSWVSGRGSGQLPWVPFGPKGLLVAIGGVLNPIDVYDGSDYPDGESDLKTESDEISPSFMQDLKIFNVDNGSWYNQTTTGKGPPQLAEFCAVVAHEHGTRSAQIYIYGGIVGTDVTAKPINKVFILSVPSFHWTEVTPLGTTSGRRGHICVMPYPDQMFVIGGTNFEHLLPEGQWIQILNVSSLGWQDSYDPSKWSKYAIPDKIKVQGDQDQKAANMDPNLAALFDTVYPEDKLPPQYSYTNHSGSKNKWLAPVLGSVLGTTVLVIAAVAIFYYCRRRRNVDKKTTGSSSSGQSETLRGSGGINEWRQQVKSVASETMEIDGSDRNTLRGSQNMYGDPQEVVEISGRPKLFAARSPRSLGVAGSPHTPLSGSVEVSGDPAARQELQDTSQHQAPLNQAALATERPDYHFRRHPLYPHNVDETMSMSQSGITTGQAVSSVGADGQVSLPKSDSVGDNLGYVLYGEVPVPATNTDRVSRIGTATGIASSEQVHHQGSTGQENVLPSEALPSPINDRPSGPRHDSNASSDLQLTPLDSEESSVNPIPGMVGISLHSPTDQSSALPRPSTPTNQMRPTHQRNSSSMSSGMLIGTPPNSLPSPDPEENKRRSIMIDRLPEGPTQTSSGVPGVPPTRVQIPRRKEVGTAVRSAYEENRMRFSDPERRDPALRDGQYSAKGSGQPET
ncbi:hypothetical protein A1O3_09409 [Capronia epimyces CBS 606.96]|uniref:Kelch repeat-containing protein n=1 Tax=Capronia epimyces CBS 606.96 TaxID=1182542 RepID=W9XDE8_9EURO|nr:uncharacterized protein A1O3_09409 [Capronia epimyces CBS 606.96]EXJ78248.1 hypothetical protein A1O3_09409 [Capronia epimyces CBS 606.96]